VFCALVIQGCQAGQGCFGAELACHWTGYSILAGPDHAGVRVSQFALGSFVSWRALIAFVGECVSTVRLLRNLMRLSQGHEAD